MTDLMRLALTYGGFTTLDKRYLGNVLAQLSDEDRLTFITPPPSVINAYFAELYQKESPEVATDYFFNMSSALNLFTTEPSFDEVKPFIRLNLSGKSYGFAYENEQEVAIVFSENKEEITEALFFELVQIFPHYKIYEENGLVKMAKITFNELSQEDLTPEKYLLSHVTKLQKDVVKISSFNQEECLELAMQFQGEAYYCFEQREFVVYVQLVK